MKVEVKQDEDSGAQSGQNKTVTLSFKNPSHPDYVDKDFSNKPYNAEELFENLQVLRNATLPVNSSTAYSGMILGTVGEYLAAETEEEKKETAQDLMNLVKAADGDEDALDAITG